MSIFLLNVFPKLCKFTSSFLQWSYSLSFEDLCSFSPDFSMTDNACKSESIVNKYSKLLGFFFLFVCIFLPLPHPTPPPFFYLYYVPSLIFLIFGPGAVSAPLWFLLISAVSDLSYREPKEEQMEITQWQGGSCLETHVRIKDFFWKITQKDTQLFTGPEVSNNCKRSDLHFTWVTCAPSSFRTFSTSRLSLGSSPSGRTPKPPEQWAVDEKNACERHFPPAGSSLTLLGMGLGLLFCGPTTVLGLTALRQKWNILSTDPHKCATLRVWHISIECGLLSFQFVVSCWENPQLKMAFLYLKMALIYF